MTTLVNETAGAMTSGQLLGGPVVPGQLPVPLPDRDPRFYALARLREYIGALTFRRAMTVAERPRGFRIPLERIHLQQPDDIVEQRYPSVAFLPARGTHDYMGLGGPMVLDETVDAYGAGTVLVQLSEYVEAMILEVCAVKPAARRSVVAGLEVALRPLADTTTLRLALPDYFDQVAVFSLGDSEYIEEPDIVKDRRRARLYVELRVPELAHIDVVALRTIIVDLGGPDSVNVLDGNTYIDLDMTAFNARLLRRGRCYRVP